MKTLRNSTLSLLSVLFLSTQVLAQSKAEQKMIEVIDRNGPQKGEVIVGMVKNIIWPPLHTTNKVKVKPTPSTVYDDLQAISRPQRDELVTIVNEQITNPNNTGAQYQYWNTFGTILNRCEGGARIGRAYGDPHIQTFDGYKYDLQSVGEFVLCRSLDGNFEVQTRQAVVSEKVSMNSACAINMVGDHISVEAAPVPNMFNQIIIVNGEEIEFEQTYTTARGVVIKKGAGHLSVLSPIGEKVLITPTNSGKYMSVVPTIIEGGNVEYEGLLGNADGNTSNDLKVDGSILPAYPSFYTMEDLKNGGKISNSTAIAEKANQKSIALGFGNYWRITNETSLFSYGKGRDTEWYTDLSYPRVHATISDHDEASVKNAQNVCEKAGVSSGDMQGCMTDVLLTGDPKAAEYSTSIQDDKVVADLKIKNPILSAKPVEVTTKEIKVSKNEINKGSAQKERVEWIRNTQSKPTNTTVVRTVVPTRISTPKPTYRPAPKPTSKPTVTRTVTRSVTRTATPKPRPTSGSTKKSTTKR